MKDATNNPIHVLTADELKHRLECIDLHSFFDSVFSSKEFQKEQDLFSEMTTKISYNDILVAKNYLKSRSELSQKVEKTAYCFVSYATKEKKPKSDIEKYLCELIDNARDFIYVKRDFCYEFVQTILRKLKIDLDEEYENKLNQLTALRPNEMPFCISMGSQPALVESQPTDSPIALVQKRGNRINLIRIANAIFELGMVERKDGGKLTKQEFFTAFGRAFNLDLSNYAKDLSTSMSTNVSYEAQTQIFDDLKQKHQEIYNSK